MSIKDFIRKTDCCTKEKWINEGICMYTRVETALFHQFSPEIISISKLLRHNIIQTLVVFGNVVDVAVIADGFEVVLGTLYLAFFFSFYG